MLRRVSCPSASPPSSQCARLSSRTRRLPLPSSTGEWRPGYAIRFASTLPDSSNASTEGHSYDSTAREGTEGDQWRPGQPIVFGEGPAQGSRQVQAGRITAHRKGKGKVIEKQLLAGCVVIRLFPSACPLTFSWSI